MTLSPKAPDFISVDSYFILSGLARAGTTVMSDILNESEEVVVFHEYPFHELVQKVDSIFDHQRTLGFVVKDLEKKTFSSIGPEESKEIEEFYRLRSSAIGLNYAERSPSEKMLADLLRFIFRRSARKEDAKIFGCKIPDYLDIENYNYLNNKLGNIKIIIMIRNLIDVVNSSIARRNNAIRGTDVWPIRQIEEECLDTISKFYKLFTIIEKLGENILLIKYEDLTNDPARVTRSAQEFLGLAAPPNTHLFAPLPPALSRFAFSDEDLSVCQQWFGDVDELWPSLALSGEAVPQVRQNLLAVAPRVESGTTWDMSLPSARRFLLEGWSEIEPWGVWTDGPLGRLVFNAGGQPPSSVTITLRVSPFRRRDFSVRVLCGRQVLGWLSCSDGALAVGPKPGSEPLHTMSDLTTYRLSLPLSFDDMTGFHSCNLTFELEGCSSPAAERLSDDTRELGVGIERLEFA